MVASLFETSPAGACPAYMNLRGATDGFLLEAREHCEDLWRDYAPLAAADANFLSDFPVQLHERWFEMYLAVVLLREGFAVSRPRPPAPDVLLDVDGRRIWIEATCANAGDPTKLDSVPQPLYARPGETPIVTERPTDAMTLRITNSLSTKARAFSHYIEQGVVDADDVAVIAINIHAIPNAWVDLTDLMRRALYGLGHPTVTFDRATNAIVGHGYQAQPTIEKSSGELIRLDSFVGDSLPHVSAVLGSLEDAGNRPPRLGDGFELCPNLGARNSWPSGMIRLGHEWRVTGESAHELELTRVSHMEADAQEGL